MKKLLTAVLAALMIFGTAFITACDTENKDPDSNDPTEETPGEEKPGEEKPGEETPDDEKPGEENPEPEKPEYSDDEFDYLTESIFNFIKTDGVKYKDYAVSLPIAKPRDYDADVTILNLLYNMSGDALNNGAVINRGTVSAADRVSIYYRGYLKDESGNEVFVPNMCNFANPSPADLDIGSNQFVPGFELHMVGIEFTEANKFVKITSGKPTDAQIIYISYTRQPEGSSDYENRISVQSERIILDTDDIDGKYGEGFEEYIRGLEIDGDSSAFSAEVGGVKYNYTNLTIDFATECEKEGTYFTVECYFPYDYGMTSLQNKTAYFDVYINGIVEFDAPVYNDQFVEECLKGHKLGITEADLEKYEGGYAEKLKSYIQSLIDEDYENAYEQALEEAIWLHYNTIFTVKKYPKKEIDKIFNEYYNDVLYQYEISGGVIINALGASITCKTVDEYAVIYLGLEYSHDKDWRNMLYTVSEEQIKERLILYYIMQKEDLLPTEEDLSAGIAAVKDEYLDEYISQYLAEYNDKRENYTDDEWADFVAKRSEELFDYYGEAYFTERVYYNIAFEAFSEWPKVTTLDGSAS